MRECPFIISQYQITFSQHIHCCTSSWLFSAIEQIVIFAFMAICSSRTSKINNYISIDHLFWAVRVLASGLLAIRLPSASSAYNLHAYFHQNILDFDVCRLCEKRVQKTAHGHTELGLSALGTTLDWEDYSLPSKAAFPGTLSCLRTQHGDKQHEVQKGVSENRFYFCVLFKVHVLILPTLYLVSLIKCQIHPGYWEISLPIKNASVLVLRSWR